MPRVNIRLESSRSFSSSSKQHGYAPAMTCCGTTQLLQGVGPAMSLGCDGLRNILPMLLLRPQPWPNSPSMEAMGHDVVLLCPECRHLDFGVFYHPC
eukprot:1190217-Prorocentrum_minimum.AAC.2